MGGFNFFYLVSIKSIKIISIKSLTYKVLIFTCYRYVMQSSVNHLDPDKYILAIFIVIYNNFLITYGIFIIYQILNCTIDFFSNHQKSVRLTLFRIKQNNFIKNKAKFFDGGHNVDNLLYSHTHIIQRQSKKKTNVWVGPCLANNIVVVGYENHVWLNVISFDYAKAYVVFCMHINYC